MRLSQIPEAPKTMRLSDIEDQWTPKKRTLADLQAMAEPVDNTQGMNPWELGYAGAGKSLYDTAQGVGQILGITDQGDVDQRHLIDQQLMDTPAGFIGNVAGQVGQMAVPGMGVARGAAMAGRALPTVAKAIPYAAAAAENAGFGALQATNTGESRAENAGLGAVFGAGGRAVGSAIGKATSGVASKLEPEARILAEKARAAGVPLGLQDITQNKTVRTVMNQLGRMPFAGGGARMQKINDAFARAVGGTFGARGKRLTQKAFDDAKQRISDKFNDLTARNSLRVTPTLVTKVQGIVDEYMGAYPSEAGPAAAHFAKKLEALAKGKSRISGTAYKEFDTLLGQHIKTVSGASKLALGDLRDALREAMDRSISPKDAAEWKNVRRMWANMKTVEPLVAKSAIGEFSPAALMQVINNNAAAKVRNSVGGGGPMQDLARIGKQFLREPPDSGSGDRAAVNMLVSKALGAGRDLGAAGGIYEAQRRDLISPANAAWAGALMLGNRYGLKALNSKAVTYGSPVIGKTAKATMPNTLASAMRAYRSGELTEEEKRDMGRVGW